MRARDTFILRMRNRRGKGTGKQRKKDDRRQPLLCGNAQATSIPTAVSDRR